MSLQLTLSHRFILNWELVFPSKCEILTGMLNSERELKHSQQLLIRLKACHLSCPQPFPVVYLAHITTTSMSVGRPTSTSISHHQLKPYQSLKCLWCTWVTHCLSCNKRREGASWILKQALRSPDIHHITVLSQQFTDPRPSALVFTAALLHSLSRWNELLWFWRWEGGGRGGGGSGDHHSRVGSERLCRSHPPLTN